MSHARQHFLRVSAQHFAGKENAAATHHASLTAYEQMLAQLIDHRRQLHDIQSTERKIELKRQLLPAYTAWIFGVLQADTGAQDEVFVTCMIWQIDVGDWAQALLMAEYAIKHNLILPDRFERTLGTFIVEEIAECALKVGGNVALDCLVEVDRMTAEQDMPDQVRAKLYKAIGYSLRESSDKVHALEYLQRAATLHEKVGVKKDIERLERELRNEQKETGSDAGETNTAAGEPPAA